MSKKCRAFSESKLGLEQPNNRKAFYAGWDAALRQALETEQEPVAWANSFDLQNFDMKVRTGPDLQHTVPLYTAPQKKEWVGLTDEDKQIAFDDTQEGGGFWEFADAIEAILKGKNGGYI